MAKLTGSCMRQREITKQVPPKFTSTAQATVAIVRPAHRIKYVSGRKVNMWDQILWKLVTSDLLLLHEIDRSRK